MISHISINGKTGHEMQNCISGVQRIISNRCMKKGWGNLKKFEANFLEKDGMKKGTLFNKQTPGILTPSLFDILSVALPGTNKLRLL